MKILKEISEKQNSCTFAKKEKNRGSFFSVLYRVCIVKYFVGTFCHSVNDNLLCLLYLFIC